MPGVYVVAVSGGVDSVVLLDLLCKKPGLHLIVAHIDHGIRPDSWQDHKQVHSIAMSHNIPFELEEANLGKGVSEETARQVRYNFLRHVRKKYNARSILTAHHQDDLLETAIINLLRGTGWRGLSSLRSTADIQRPLLGVPKADLVAYARQHNLKWREDFTNLDTHYLRNYVRHTVLSRAGESLKKILLQYIVRQNELTRLIDNEVATWIKKNVPRSPTTASLPRYPLIMMSARPATEILQHILRDVSRKSIERPLAQNALLFIKVAKPHKIFQLDSRWQLRAGLRQVVLEPIQHLHSAPEPPVPAANSSGFGTVTMVTLPNPDEFSLKIDNPGNESEMVDGFLEPASKTSAGNVSLVSLRNAGGLIDQT